MLSLDPATITGERCPLLFQTGETAYGKPLVDAQHPHNFIMSLGVHYAREFGEDTTLELYFAPVGDPALGPWPSRIGTRRRNFHRRQYPITGRIQRTLQTKL
jgi:hypothetical protein